jgi:hypothetical protein
MDGEDGMRVTRDKNGAPFGFCENCAAQLRVGGNARRVRLFERLHPWAAEGAVPVTVAAPVAAPVTEKIPVTVTGTVPAKKKATFLDALSHLGVNNG